MLSRYTIYRRRPKDAEPLPDGVRQDTRRHTKHVLRPEKEMVDAILLDSSDAAWEQFEKDYLALLESRFREDKARFEKLATLAMEQDVYLGCSCPTKKRPNVLECHTCLALGFMQEKFSDLLVRFPNS